MIAMRTKYSTLSVSEATQLRLNALRFRWSHQYNRRISMDEMINLLVAQVEGLESPDSVVDRKPDKVAM